MNDDQQALKTIEAFVLSSIRPKEFERLLLAFPALEELLRREPPLPPYSTSPAHNLYQYLLEADYSSPRAVMNAQAGLSTMLERHGISSLPVHVFSEKMKILESAQPKWLDLTESYGQSLIAEAGALQGTALRNWFKTELRKRFRCVSTAPKWLQSPYWPVHDGVPLVFLGQVKAGKLLHDDAQVYVFMHPDSSETVTVLQRA